MHALLTLDSLLSSQTLNMQLLQVSPLMLVQQGG